VHVEDGKVTKIEGDPDFPANQGALCPKGLAYTQQLYHKDRLKYPLKKSGEGWERISWDGALDTIASKLSEIKEEYGAKSIAWEWGDGRRGHELVNYLLMYSLGSPNILHTDSHYCFQPQWLAEQVTYGSSLTGELGPDCRNSKCILVWGANPFQAHMTKGQEIMEGIEKGAKLIVIDPRFSETASKADLWLQVRPGTDGALALGMLNIIINEELYDKDFVKKWCFGFDRLAERVTEYPPSKVAKITEVPEEKIKAAARTFAKSKPACVYIRMGVCESINSVQTIRGIANLIPITGNLDKKGGNVNPTYPQNYKNYIQTISNETRGLLSKEEENERIGAEMYPLHRGADAKTLRDCHPPSAYKTMLTGKPYKIRALLLVNDPIMGLEGSRKVQRALKELGFLVVTDFFMTPTAKLADVILPAATYLEKDELHGSRYMNYIAASPKVIDPIGECKDEKWICNELFKRLGLDPPIPILPEELFNYRLKPLGITWGELKEKHVVEFPMRYEKYKDSIFGTTSSEKGKTGFNTPTGKVELYSTLLEKHGYAPLPHYKEPPESPISTPELVKEYPYNLITGSRDICYLHSAQRNIPWLREISPDPRVEINPKTAREKNIREGDWVWIETPKSRGKVKLKAKLTSGIAPGVIHAYSHWWYPEKIDEDYESACFESNINVILSMDPPYEPIVGSTPLRGRLCKIQKVGE